MYSNSKNQISLEEAYRRVHLEEKDESKDECCDDCKKGKKCTCEDDEEVTEENVDSLEYGLRTAHQIVADAPDGMTNITRLLPMVLGAAVVALGVYRERATEIVADLMERINIGKIRQEITPLEQKQKELAAAAEHNMEKQVELNKVEDEILEQIVMKGIDQIYQAGHGVPPSKIVDSLRKELEKRINSRK